MRLTRQITMTAGGGSHCEPRQHPSPAWTISMRERKNVMQISKGLHRVGS